MFNILTSIACQINFYALINRFNTLNFQFYIWYACFHVYSPNFNDSFLNFHALMRCFQHFLVFSIQELRLLSGGFMHTLR